MLALERGKKNTGHAHINGLGPAVRQQRPTPSSLVKPAQLQFSDAFGGVEPLG